MQSSTGDAVNAIRAITRCMEDINAHTSEVADAITRQELATGEISHNVASAAAQSKAAAAAFGMLSTAAEAGTKLTFGEIAERNLSNTVDAGIVEQDWSAIHELARKKAGLV